MTPTASDAQRPRRTYDHRLRAHVVRCGPMAVAKHIHIPRSTVSTWRRRGLRPVVTAEPFDQEKQDAVNSSARWQKRARILAAVVRLLLALLRASGFTLDGNRLPDGKAKAGILRAITSAEAFLPLATILHIIGLEPGRYHAWRRDEKACELTDRSSCPRTSPGQLTGSEEATIKEMVLSPEYRHMPLGTLARYAQLFINSLESIERVCALVAFHVEQHNTKMPHAAFEGQTPDEMYFGTATNLPGELAAAKNNARAARLAANRALSCQACLGRQAAPPETPIPS
jgi:hypothetical protein